MRHAPRPGHAVILALIALAAPIARPGEARGAQKPDEFRRWNDRSSPRRTLETFWFACYCYDVEPALIADAIDCLDLGGIDPAMRERDAALLAHELNFISSRLDVPLYTVPDRTDATEVSLTDLPGFRLVLARQEDGRWRFDRETVVGVGRMRALAAERNRLIEEARLRMAAGRTDPEATMRTFLGALARHDGAAAAECLDLRDVPATLRADRGPVLARKLGYAITRCGFVFPQELPSDPAGFRYVWHSNHRGRIMLERVRAGDGSDAWLFARGTLANLDALVDGLRATPPDPRYSTLGAAGLDAIVAADGPPSVEASESVPRELRSPRRTLQTFLEVAEELDVDESRAAVLIACLDLRGSPAEGHPAAAIRLAAKLGAVLRRSHVDLLGISDSWQAEPLVLGRDTDWRLVLARGPDGAWRFDQDTVARASAMFERLPAAERSAQGRRSTLDSARQTLRTLLLTVDRGDLAAASECLDLSGLPAGVRSELGPLLAAKLKFVLDRVGRPDIGEVPDEPDGPRFYCYRGVLGRIDLVRRDTAPHAGAWQFSAESVVRIDAMARAVIHRPAAPSAGSGTARPPHRAHALHGPRALGRRHVPAWAQVSLGGIDLYQWLGMALIALASWVVGRLALHTSGAIVGRLLRGWDVALGPLVLHTRLRPLAVQCALWSAYALMRWVDLPVTVYATIVPVLKVLWVGLVAWLGLSIIDLVMAVYTNSSRLTRQRSLGDMVVPTAVRGLKLLIGSPPWERRVYLVGSAETFTRLLAGLGLVGLAASLAAQDTLKNFFGTLLLIGEHPFRIGDTIAVGGMVGTVESVGFRSTRMRSEDGSLLTVPNSVIVTASIDNRGARTFRRLKMSVPLAFDNPLERVAQLCDEILAFTRSQLQVGRDRVDVRLDGMGPNGIDLTVDIRLDAATLAEETACRDQLSRAVLRLAWQLEVGLGQPVAAGRLLRIDEPHAPAPSGRHADLRLYDKDHEAAAGRRFKRPD